MRILLSWVKEFVDAPEPAGELARALTKAGLTVESVAEERGETVLEIELNTNRPDAMNHFGVAREVAAIYGRELRRPKVEFREAAKPAGESAAIEIADAALCARYVGRVAADVKIAPSPDWMRRRLEQCEIRAINNVADVTNYVLLEIGQPTHAFDLDTLGGARIVVRRAAAGERLTTLDGVARALDRESLVIADAKRAVALAGVMGGAETEISARTRNVLIESAWFDPASIRRTARRLNLHTEASHRFERGADVEAAPWAADRIAGLLEQLAGATVLAGRIDCYPSERRRTAIPLRASSLRRHLGIEIPPDEVERILEALGFRLDPREAGWEAIPPTWRLDVEREIDVIEEVARLYGYDRFPSRLPAWSGGAEAAPNARAEQRLAEAARSLGYDEAITYSFIGSAEAGRFGSWPAVAVRNPVSELQDVLRNSAVPGLLRAVEWNLNRGQNEARLFEIGRLYRAEGGTFSEPPVMALAATGRAKLVDFFHLKADVTSLLNLFAGQTFHVEQPTDSAYYRAGHSAQILADGVVIARFGEIHPELAAERKFRHPVLLAEIWLDRLYRLGLRQPSFRPLPRMPAVDRDFSLLLPEGTPFERIVEAAGRPPHLVRLEPVEIFRGEQVPEGKYSLLLRAVWQREDATLTDEEVNGYAREIVETLKREFGAEQR